MKAEPNELIIHHRMGYGLTKREYFAAMALQGLLSVYDNGNGLVPNIGTANYMANLSVAAADALINALNETK